MSVPNGEYEYQYSYGLYLNNRHNDAMIISEKHVETGETRLKIIREPSRPYWISHPDFRNFNVKKEYVSESELIKFTCRERDLHHEIARKVGFPIPRYGGCRDVLNNLWVYGADIPIESLYRIHYQKLCSRPIKSYRVGMMDIETDVTGRFNKSVIVAAYADLHTHTIYQVILKDFLDVDPETQREAANNHLQELYGKLNDKCKEYVRKYPFKVKVEVVDTEKELLVRIFQHVNHCKPDFCGFWNMAYDIPYMLKRMKENNLNPADVICHPDIPKEFRYCKWYYDNSKVEHFTDKWNWFKIPGYTVYYDAQKLYSRLRKVKGRESKYGLDYISSKTIGAGKLTFGENKTHYAMQMNEPSRYCSYNCGDVIEPLLMDWQHNDTLAMNTLIGICRLEDFARQTVRLRDTFFAFCREINAVVGSCSGDRTTDYDHLIHNIGGAVLHAAAAMRAGVPIIQEYLQRQISRMNKYVQDLDVSSMYPSIVAAFKIALRTLVSIALKVEGMSPSETARFFASVTSPDVNAVEVCSRYFGLPNYNEALKLFKAFA